MLSSFEPDKVYHVYTHANGSECLFREEENYHYFLKKYTEHLYPVLETFAYCLMPNHLHLMIRVRSEEQLMQAPNLTGFQNLSGLVSRHFGNFFNAYTKAFNKRYNRTGSLFQRPFKRKPIENDGYFTRLITYIHNNPVHHNFVKEPTDWPHSSWHAYLSEKSTRLMKQEGLSWFGGREEFIKIHQQLALRDVMLDFE